MMMMMMSMMSPPHGRKTTRGTKRSMPKKSPKENGMANTAPRVGVQIVSDCLTSSFTTV